MADTAAELGIVIENKVEGPQPLIETHIPQKDFLGQWEHDPDGWALSQISNQMPEGVLKNAIDAATIERLERKRLRLMDWDPDIITEEAKKYAFRTVKRRSDGEPTWEDPNATSASLEENLFIHGTDTPNEDSANYISPGHVWNSLLFPGPHDFERGDIDMSEILVYKNEPYVFAPKPGDTNATLVKNREVTKISLEEAKHYPTLRDIFLGRVEVRFDKNGIPFEEMFQWDT